MDIPQITPEDAHGRMHREEKERYIDVRSIPEFTQGHPEGAVNILYKRELEAAADPDALRTARVEEFRNKLANPFIAAGRGFLDEVISPRLTRARVVSAFRSLEGKRDKNPPKKHGNIPL